MRPAMRPTRHHLCQTAHLHLPVVVPSLRAQITPNLIYCLHPSPLRSHLHRVFRHTNDENAMVSLAAGGFAAGTLIMSAEVPAGLEGANKIFFKMGKLINLQNDAKSTGFGRRHHSAHVNYYRLFNKFDIDQTKVTTRHPPPTTHRPPPTTHHTPPN